MSDAPPRPDVAFVGYGEAGHAIVTGWGQARPARINAYDLKSGIADQRAALQARYAAAGVAGADSLVQALQGIPVVFSTVTADQALVAARQAAAALAPGALWLDCNSCAPDTKRAAAEVIGAAGGRYVDVAVMAPVYPKQHLVPLLVSGPEAQAGIAALTALGMRPKYMGEAVGRASSIKMLRSVMIKGMEALTAECVLAARRAGVEEEVIASLEASDPGVKWRERGAYNLERMMVHGARRAAEMHEVAKTVAALGLSDGMASATADWQARIAEIGADPGPEDLFERADRILSRL
jgi:3-hydroxyisobutyrate dehydrogenase-like beta-hydroxyacid dehydrogenase